MNKEVLFAQSLEQIRKLAKQQGNCVSEEQVREKFAQLELSDDKLQMVYDYLLQHKVGIGEPMEPDDFLTDEERDYLQDYLDEIAKMPMCSESERQAYTISAMAGEARARNRLVELYLKDVAEIAKLYAGQGVYLEDLIGEGNVALAMGVTMLGSLERPEEAQGMLGKMIMDAMEEYIKENADNQKKDQRVADRVNEVFEKAKELSEDLRRKVTVKELAAETRLTRKAIEDAVRMSGFGIEYIDSAAKDILPETEC